MLAPMFIHWLFCVFPAEMHRGWRLVRPDLFVWTILALALAAIGQAPKELALWISSPLVLLLIVLIPIRFSHAAHGQRGSWSQAVAVFWRRGLSVLLFTALVVTISAGLGVVASMAAIVLTRGTPWTRLASASLGTTVYLTLLVSYCFVPYLVVLASREEALPPRPGKRQLMERMRAKVWPLVASSRMTKGLRWRLFPYLLLLNAGTVAAVSVPASLRAPLQVLWQLVGLTAQAVMFDYYLARRPGRSGQP